MLGHRQLSWIIISNVSFPHHKQWCTSLRDLINDTRLTKERKREEKRRKKPSTQWDLNPQTLDDGSWASTCWLQWLPSWPMALIKKTICHKNNLFLSPDESTLSSVCSMSNLKGILWLSAALYNHLNRWRVSTTKQWRHLNQCNNSYCTFMLKLNGRWVLKNLASLCSSKTDYFKEYSVSQ